jgi:SAM-dependent methyltransferase
MICRVCAGTEGTRHLAREMMFGTGQMFPYFQCARCECLQIEAVPGELELHYPPDYYAFTASARSGLRRHLRRLRDRTAFSPIWTLTGVFAPQLRPPAYVGWMRHVRAARGSRILDVGCGAGELLADMARAGFDSLLGVDPFIRDSVIPGTSVRLLNSTIDALDGTFDIIMFHHSLEHIADQRGALAAARDRLAPGGWCIVRVPTVSSWAWQHYRENWVQLDAPRHLMIHSVESLRLTAAAAGLELESSVYDSTELQFAGSELYTRNLPLAALLEEFSSHQLRKWRREAERLNAARQGDQAAFYFRSARDGVSATTT